MRAARTHVRVGKACVATRRVCRPANHARCRVCTPQPRARVRQQPLFVIVSRGYHANKSSLPAAQSLLRRAAGACRQAVRSRRRFFFFRARGVINLTNNVQQQQVKENKGFSQSKQGTKNQPRACVQPCVTAATTNVQRPAM